LCDFKNEIALARLCFIRINSMQLALATRLEPFSRCRGALARDPVAEDRPDCGHGRKVNQNNEFLVGLR
jgi:hypothetical protein